MTFRKSYGGTGIVIPVKKHHRSKKNRNPEDSCRNYQPMCRGMQKSALAPRRHGRLDGGQMRRTRRPPISDWILSGQCRS